MLHTGTLLQPTNGTQTVEINLTPAQMNSKTTSKAGGEENNLAKWLWKKIL